MKKIFTFGIIHISLLLFLLNNEYQKTKQLYSVFSSIATNNTLHLIHTLFVMYVILLLSKILLYFTIGSVRNDELSSVNDNCFLFLTDILLIVTIFSDDLSVKNLILFVLLMALKCINWIVTERIKNQINLKIYLLIAVVFLIASQLSVGSLVIAFKKPSLYILYGFEFGILAISNIRNTLFCLAHLQSEDRRTIHIFVIDIAFIATRLASVILFFFITTVYFRLPFNLIREALGTARLLHKKIKGFVQFLRISRELAMCEDSPGEGTCPICFAEMETGKKITCGHVFHTSCLKKWVETSEVCPICRREMFFKEVQVVFNAGNERITGIPIVYDD